MAGLVQTVKTLDPSKDYSAKVSALLGRGAFDMAFLSLSAAALWFHARRHADVRLRTPHPAAASACPDGSRSARFRLHRNGVALLVLILAADLLRLHWDHFYLFPAGYYRAPPASAQVLDRATAPFWRVFHYLEYPGLEMWDMHNDPVSHFDLLEREKTALSCGVHAVFGYRHVTAHLPLMWKWKPGMTAADKSGRYLFSNRDLSVYDQDSVKWLVRFGSVNAYESVHWKPRIGLGGFSDPARVVSCPEGYSGYRGICVLEKRDGEMSILSRFIPGDTLIVRERFDAEWKFRVDGGAWHKPLETAEHFQAIPIEKESRVIDLVYSPVGFYRLAGLAMAMTVLIGGFFSLRKKKP
jgi:hypothetical protein